MKISEVFTKIISHVSINILINVRDSFKMLKKTDKDKYDKYITFCESSNEKLSVDEKKYIKDTWKENSIDGKYMKYSFFDQLDENEISDKINLSNLASIDEFYSIVIGEE